MGYQIHISQIQQYSIQAITNTPTHTYFNHTNEQMESSCLCAKEGNFYNIDVFITDEFVSDDLRSTPISTSPSPKEGNENVDFLRVLWNRSSLQQ